MATGFLQALYERRGIALAFISSIIWSVNSLGTQISTQTVSPWILCFVNSLLYLPSLFFIRWEYSDRYRLSDGLLILFAAISDSASLCFATLGFTFTTIGNASALIFSKSLICLILSKLFLNERMGICDVCLTVANIIGVVLITKPRFIFENTDVGDIELWGSLAALLSAVCGSFMLICIRKLAERDVYDPAIVLLVTGIVGHVLYGILMFITMNSHYHMKTPSDWSYVILTCFAGIVACSLLYFALKFESAYVVALVTTTEVASSYFLQVACTDDNLELVVVVGALLIAIIPVWYAVRGIFIIQTEAVNDENE